MPNGLILTSLGRVTAAGHGEWAHVYNLACDRSGPWIIPGTPWRPHDDTGVNTQGTPVIWRPTPPRTVTVELTEDDARNIRNWAGDLHESGPAWRPDLYRACRAALEEVGA